MPHENGLPWPQLMEIAFGMLGITPEAFWAMTPPEWLAAWGGLRRKYGMTDLPAANISRGDLHELINRFPD